MSEDMNSAWLEREESSEEEGGAEHSEEEEEEDRERMVLNPTSVRDRIDSDLATLSDFSNRADKTVSRSDVLASLAASLTEYYGYIPDLVNLFLDLFSPAECVEYMDASDRPRPLVIRTNTLKMTRKDLMEVLSKRGVNLEAIDWSKVAIKVTESTIPIGATPEYLAGYYMLQAAASLNPVMALEPKPGERVLDMSSAPGGKTSYIAQLMKNSGTVVANDLKPQRQKATVANLHRMGVKNAIVCCYDGRKIPKIMKGFDRVMLDAPCSGLGIISRDQSVKLQRTLKDVQRLSHLQKELLLAAIDATNPDSKSGGVIVYSTCSISNEENEQVVQYALQKRHVRLVDTGLAVGRPGYTRYKERRFHPSLKLTRRFYPHVHNMDGFYVAKFRKYKNGPRSGVLGEASDEEEPEEEEWDSLEDEESGNEIDEVAVELGMDEKDHVEEPSTKKRKKVTPAFSEGNGAINTSKKKNDKIKTKTQKNKLTPSNDAKLKSNNEPKDVIDKKESSDSKKEATSTSKKRSRNDSDGEKKQTPKESDVISEDNEQVRSSNARVVRAEDENATPQIENEMEEIYSPAMLRPLTPRKKKRNSIANLRAAARAAKNNV